MAFNPFGGQVVFPPAAKSYPVTKPTIVPSGVLAAATLTFDASGDAVSGTSSSALFALVTKSGGDQSVTAGSGAVTWDTVTNDVGGFTNLGTHNTRLTVPANINYVQLAGNLSVPHSPATFSDLILVMQKNGTNFVGQGVSEMIRTGENFINCSSGIISVTAGDYFELFYIVTDPATIAASVSTWFSIKAIA